MKRDLFSLLLSSFLFILIIILSLYSLKQKKIIESIHQNSYKPDPSLYDNLMAKSYYLNSFRIHDNYIFTPDRDSILLSKLPGINEKIVIFLSQNVCLPCAERFFNAAEKYCKELRIENITVIVEIINLRQISLMLNNLSSFEHVYFTQDYFLPQGFLIEKPCLFILAKDLSVKNALIFDDSLINLLYDWLKISKLFTD